MTNFSIPFSETHPSSETFCGGLEIDMEKALKPERERVEKMGSDVTEHPPAPVYAEGIMT